jgi:hypothetical protein
MERPGILGSACAMKHLFVIMLMLCGSAFAAPVDKLDAFELTDQDGKVRRYQFPRSKVTVMTVAGRRGYEQLAPWIRQIYGRYKKRIDIEGIADVSMIARPFRGIFRTAFKRQLTYSVMLDWEGSVVRQFDYKRGVANVYVIDRRGRILKQLTGPVRDSAMRELTRVVDRALGNDPKDGQ